MASSSSPKICTHKEEGYSTHPLMQSSDTRYSLINSIFPIQQGCWTSTSNGGLKKILISDNNKLEIFIAE